MRTLWGSATDCGQVRTLNEDALLAYPPVFLVADGMGGHDAGDVASKLVVEEFSLLLGRDAATSDEIHDCFGRSAKRLRDAVAGRIAGTTVAGAAVATHEGGEYWLVFNIGDSRVYRLAGGELEQISVDHSVVQELIDGDAITVEEARTHPERHVITKALGTVAEPDPDYWMLPAGAGDRLLICSDGLTTELDHDLLLHGLTSFVDPQQAADWLVGAAVEAGGRDNVTAVVVDVAAAWSDLAATERTHARDVEQSAPARPVRGEDGEPWDTAVHGSTIPYGGGAR